MPSFDEDRLLAQTRDTPLAVTGAFIGPALQVGAAMQQDKVRYVWRINVSNLDPAAAHTLFLYAGDAANTQRRLIFSVTIPLSTSIDFPQNGAHVKNHMFKVPILTSFAPDQETGIYITDEAGGTLLNVVISQYDLRGG